MEFAETNGFVLILQIQHSLQINHVLVDFAASKCNIKMQLNSSLELAILDKHFFKEGKMEAAALGKIS